MIFRCDGCEKSRKMENTQKENLREMPAVEIFPPAM